MKILSDFDGVWTDPGPEAEAVRRLWIERTAELSGIDEDRVDADLRHLAAVALARPGEHGWAPNGRISAFADEDPLILGNAVADLMRRWGEGDGPRDGEDAEIATRCARYVAAIRAAGHESIDAYANDLFGEGTSGFRAKHGSALRPGALEAALGLLERGIELVVVSNSTSEKILAWFEAAGIPARDAKSEDPGDDPRVVVRGSAGKFVLGPDDEQIECGGRRIYVDRPMYRDVLRLEAPDLVLGDVFSLDLALPHALRRAGVSYAPQTLVLARRDYTPAWAGVERAGGAIDRVVDGLDELLDL